MTAAIENKILESKEIINRAIVDYQPYATVAMFSGGTDSLGVLALLKYMDIKIDFVLHGNTGTGLPPTLEFVRNFAAAYPAKYIEGCAGNVYEKYVLRKGFFGRGNTAHAYAYHLLKSDVFERTLSREIIQRRKGRKILLINGVRDEESDNRSEKYDGQVVNIYPRKKNNIWVNLIFWWSKKEIEEFLSGIGVQKNPVSLATGRSNECNCGTMQSQADRMVAADYCPAWGKWLDDLERQVIAKGFPWRWGQDISKRVLMERDGQIALFTDEPMPMCVGCKSRFNKQQSDGTL